MRSRLSRLLALLLMPVLILFTSDAASAADGDWAGATWDVSGFTAGPLELMDFECGASFGMGVVSGGFTMYVRDGWCIGGADTSPGFCQIGEADCTQITYTFNGAGCEGLAIQPTDYAGPNDGWAHTDMRIDMASAFTTACDPAEACINITAAVLGSDSTAYGCTVLNLDPPADTGPDFSACADGGPASSPTMTFEDLDSWGGAYNGYEAFTMNATLTTTKAVQYRLIGWWTAGGVTQFGDSGLKSAGPGTNIALTYSSGATNMGAEPIVIKGVQLIITSPTHNVSGADGWSPAGSLTWTALRTGVPDYNMGAANMPSRCSFYFGAKMANTANDTTDEPIGDLGAPLSSGTTEPGGTPAQTPVAESEPTDDLGWLEWLAGLLKTLIKMVAGLVAAIGDLLHALFVPDPSSWGFDGLLDQFEARPPGSVVMGIGDGMSSFVDGYSGGGCGTLADFSSEDIDATLTCSNVKSVPGYGALYSLIQVALFGLTGLSVFRTMASKVGGDS